MLHTEEKGAPESVVIAVSEQNLGQFSQRLEDALAEDKEFKLDFSEIIRAVNLRTDAAAHLGPYLLWSWKQNDSGEREPVCLYHPTENLWRESRSYLSKALYIKIHGGDPEKVPLGLVYDQLMAEAESYNLAHSLYLGSKLPFGLRTADESTGKMQTGDDRDQIHDHAINALIRAAEEIAEANHSTAYLAWMAKIIQVRSMLRTIVQMSERMPSKSAFVAARIAIGGEAAEEGNIESAFTESFDFLKDAVKEVVRLLKEEQACREKFYEGLYDPIIVSRALSTIPVVEHGDETKQVAISPHHEKVDFVLPNGANFSPREYFLERAQDAGFVAPVASEMKEAGVTETIAHLIQNPHVKEKVEEFVVQKKFDASITFAEKFMPGIEENFVPIQDGLAQPNPKIKGTVVKTRQSIVTLAEDGSAKVRDVFTWGSAYDHTLQLSLTVDYDIDLTGNLVAVREQIIVHNPTILNILKNLRQIPEIDSSYEEFTRKQKIIADEWARHVGSSADQGNAPNQKWWQRVVNWVSKNRRTLIVGLTITAILCVAIPFLWPVSIIAGITAAALAGTAGIATGAKLVYDHQRTNRASESISVSVEVAAPVSPLPKAAVYSVVAADEMLAPVEMDGATDGYCLSDPAQVKLWADQCSLIHTVGTELPPQVTRLRSCPPAVLAHFSEMDAAKGAEPEAKPTAGEEKDGPSAEVVHPVSQVAASFFQTEEAVEVAARLALERAAADAVPIKDGVGSSTLHTVEVRQ